MYYSEQGIYERSIGKLEWEEGRFRVWQHAGYGCYYYKIHERVTPLYWIVLDETYSTAKEAIAAARKLIEKEDANAKA